MWVPTTHSRPKSQASHTAKFDSGLLFTQSRSFAQSANVRQKGEPAWGDVSWASDKTAGHTESFSFQVPSCLVMQTFYRFGKQVPAVLEGRKITFHFLVMLCVSAALRRKAQIDGK